MLNSILSIFKAKEQPKVICRCMNVMEKDIMDAIDKGANSFEEVQVTTKLGTGCGNCVEGNKKLVDEVLLNKKINEDQIVCGCMKVRVQDIVNAIKDGARSFEEVQAVTKVGTGCGNCVESNKALFAHLIK